MNFLLFPELNNGQGSLRILPSPTDERVPENERVRCEGAIKGAGLFIEGWVDDTHLNGEESRVYKCRGKLTPEELRVREITLAAALEKAEVELTLFDPEADYRDYLQRPEIPVKNPRFRKSFRLPIPIFK